MKRLSKERKARLLLRAAERERRRVLHELRLAARRNESTSVKKVGYLDPLAYFAGRVAAAKRKRRRMQTLGFPERFSFIDDPNGTIEVLEGYAAAALSRPGRMLLNQRPCTVVDLCAESVLNALIRIARKRYRCRYSGMLPTDPRRKEIVRATGIPRELGIESEENLPKGIYYLGLIQGRADVGKSRQSSECEIRTTEVIEYINRCLGRYSKTLTPEGAGAFSNMFGEVINNCEDHAERAEWWVSAYLEQIEGEAHGELQLVIFNFGQTIAEGLLGMPEDSEIRRAIGELRDHHLQRGSFRSGVFTEENLWTVCALQSGISRKNPEVGVPGHRGTGTVRLIEAFFRLGQRKDAKVLPSMALVSGRTQILFDGKYSMRTVSAAGSPGRKVISFNATDLWDPPDPRSVRVLDRFFPGTVLSCRFFIDPGHLDTVPEYATNN